MTALAPGETLGGYEVLAHLATGGMAEVYRVRDQRTGDQHALKVLVQDELRAMFDREYELMNTLNHPSVVRAYRYGSGRGKPWYSMELIRGEAASQAVKVAKPGTQARTSLAIRIIGLAARALDHVHRRGLVHRDVKPANLVVMPDARIRLVDFGTALALGTVDPIVAAGGFVGTLGFVPPDVMEGGPIGPSTDLYGLGVTLYRLVSGRNPFKAEGLAEYRKLQRAGEFVDMGQVPGVPAQLARLAAELLDPDPARRPGTGAIVAQRLDLLAGATILPGTRLAWFDDDAPDPPGPLDLAATASRVGWRVGRRPPTGRAAADVYDACGGVPAAIDELVRELVRSDQVEADGNNVYWARDPLDLPVVASLRDALVAQVKACTPAQRLALQALCRVGAASLILLGRLLPNPAALHEALRDLEQQGLVLRNPRGRYQPASATLARVVAGMPGGLPVSVLENKVRPMLDDLPPTAFRIRAQLAAGRVDRAVAGVLEEGATLVDAGRWRELATLIDPIWELEAAVEPNDEVARAFVLCGRLALAMGWRDARGTKAVAVARRVACSPAVQLEVQLLQADLNAAIGHYEKAQRELEEAIGRARSVADPQARAATALALARSHRWVGDNRGAVRRYEEVLAQGDAVAPRARARALAGVACCAAITGDLDGARTRARGALELPTDDPAAHADAIWALGMAHRFAGELTAAITVLADGVAGARMRDDALPMFQLLLGLAACELDLNRLGLAQEHLDELNAAMHAGIPPHLRLRVSLLEGRIQLQSGDRVPAAFALGQVRDAAHKARLADVADEARTWAFEALGPDRANPSELDAWLQARRIAFLDRQDLWAYAEATLVYLRCREGADPGILDALEQTLGARTAPGVRVQIALQRAQRAREAGDAGNARKSSQDAAGILARMAKDLGDSERFAMRVHPWGHQIRATLDTATSGRATR